MDLLKPIIESANAESLLGTYLHSCQEQLSFITQDASEEKSLLTAINTKLNEPSTRFVGLCLLDTYLQNCPQNTVNENAISWMSHCLRGTVSPVPATSNLSYRVLCCLFCRCSDQAKHVASAVLPKLFQHLQSVPDHCIPSALSCLESCMKIYNGSCGPHKHCIEKFLIPLLEYSGPNKAVIVWKASVCLALVPQIGGGGAAGVIHQENWTKQLKAACSTLHGILDELLSSVHELEVHNVEATRVETLPLEPVPEKDPISKAYALAARFDGVVCCVEAMLLNEFGVVKNVPPSAVLSVICRGLAVTPISLQNTVTTESLALVTLLPLLQTKLFELMRALISCCGANLLPFGRLVIKLVLQTLKWSLVKDWKHKTTKPYRLLRTAAYSCMKHWLDCVRTVPSCEELAEFVEMACGDFRSEEDGVRLLFGKKKSKYGDRNEAKRKRASTATSSNANSAASAASAEEESAPTKGAAANKDVCVAALEAVQALLAVHGWALNGGSYTMLNETTTKLILSVSCHPHNPVFPYGDPEARRELYRLLSSLVTHPHPHIAAPIRMAWTLFSLGQNDPHLQVSMFCSQALSTLEKIVHPSFVPLALPIPEAEEEQGASNLVVAPLTDHQSLVQKQSTSAVEPDAQVLGKNKKNRQSSPSKQAIENTEKSVVKKSEKLEDKTEARKEPEVALKEDAHAQDERTNGLDEEMIDVSDTSDGADIEEVPVEINLADSEASSDVDAPATQESSELTDGIEILDDVVIDEVVINEVDRKCALDDFRLIISPEPGSSDQVDPATADKDSIRCSKRPAVSVDKEAKEKRVVSSSCPLNGGGGAADADADDDDVSPPKKVLVVAAEADNAESDVEAMLASFVDKVKPIYNDM